MMIWDSWSAFFEMGGYGLYVWGSVVLTCGLLFGEMLLLKMRWNTGLRQLGNWLRSEKDDEQRNNDENKA